MQADQRLISRNFQPLGASDYLQLTQYFHTILIRDVPQLNLRLKSQTRRFITLIDTLYDNRVRVGSGLILVLVVFMILLVSDCCVGRCSIAAAIFDG
jgi:AFG1-like ATPase